MSDNVERVYDSFKLIAKRRALNESQKIKLRLQLHFTMGACGWLQSISFQSM